jgi:RNA polymerase sigma factor (sigma-70 family)
MSDLEAGFQTDAVLIQRCLSGDEQGWSELLAKYKNLIFSVPIKLGFSPEDASDIFQSVCVAVLRELEQLREPRALPAWLISLTWHKCMRWNRKHRKYILRDYVEEPDSSPVDWRPVPEEIVAQAEREQILREATAELPDLCAKLIELLFFETPAVPYEEAAKRLGMAKGSIGATRMRCLEKQRRLLEKRGFGQ